MYDESELEQLKRHLPDYVSSITRHDRTGRADYYICPICGSGGHMYKNSDSGFHLEKDNRTLWHCHSCGNGGDIFTLIGLQEGLTEFSDQVKRARELYGTPQDDTMQWRHTANADAVPFQSVNHPPLTDQSSTADPERYITPNTPHKYDSKFQSDVAVEDQQKVVDYLKGRGLTEDTINRYHLTYSREFFGGAGELDSVIFPYSSSYSYYSARSLDGKHFKKPREDDAGSEPIYNPAALYQAKEPCFVTESPLDALSIIQCGGQAVALCGTAYQKLLTWINENWQDGKQHCPALILFLDHDAMDDKGHRPGPEKQAELAKKLKKKGIPFIKFECDFDAYTPKNKDANDLLVSNAEKLKADVSRNVEKAKAKRYRFLKPENDALHYVTHKMPIDIQRFRNSAVSTGFENLDSKCIAMYPGLYVVAAISSLGKTTFCGQMADQIAEQGHPVMYFSLEQSELDIVSKSIARIEARYAGIPTDPDSGFVSSQKIHLAYTSKILSDATAEYMANIAPNMYIFEGDFSATYSYIEGCIEEYIQTQSEDPVKHPLQPVVIIDYLQLIQPPEDAKGHQTVRETVDQTVSCLKRLSRKHNITIIAICSVNRANYLTPIDLESLKESGGIEYTADVVWGLQLQCLTTDPIFTENDGDKKKTEKREAVRLAKKENPRKISLVCLKNRFGVSSYECHFRYYPADDIFLIDDDAEKTQTGKDKREDDKLTGQNKTVDTKNPSQRAVTPTRRNKKVVTVED